MSLEVATLCHSDSDKNILSLLDNSNREIESLSWWAGEYLRTRATGAASTLRYKLQDLGHFVEWFVWAMGRDEVRRWNTAVSNAYISFLDSETVPEGATSTRKVPGVYRWAARSKNRKIDHLRTFARWISEQVPCPILSGYPMRDISRFEVPVLEAKRFNERELLRMEAAVFDLGVTEIKRDKRRGGGGVRELRKDARPMRDQAIYALLIGSGLRVQAVANLNIDQLDFSGQIKRLTKVREKGRVERDVIITRGAADAIARYVESERMADSEAWNGARALFLSVPFQAKKRDDTRKGGMTTRALSYIIGKIADAAGLTGVHPHRFRHHVGYLMNERGGITAVQKQLGHRNIAYSAGYCQRTDDELSGYLE